MSEWISKEEAQRMASELTALRNLLESVCECVESIQSRLHHGPPPIRVPLSAREQEIYDKLTNVRHRKKKA